MIKATQCIDVKLRRSIRAASDSNDQKSNSWCSDPQYFKSPGKDSLINPGIETFSPGWQAQGHHVCSPIS